MAWSSMAARVLLVTMLGGKVSDKIACFVGDRVLLMRAFFVSILVRLEYRLV